MHGHTVALILHHPQCRYLKICHVLYLHALCRDTKGPRPFYQVYSLATFFLRAPLLGLWTKRLLDRCRGGCFSEKYELGSATNVFQLLPKLTRESAIWTSSSRKVSFLPTWLESSIRFRPTAFYELCSVNQDDLGFGGFFWRCKPAS